MKKITILIWSLLMPLAFELYAQNLNTDLPIEGINYKYVLLEEFTGSWCNTCPPTAQAIDTMLKHKLKIAPIAYQIELEGGDMMKYYIYANWERSNFYDTIRSIPDVFFNGNLHNNSGFGDATNRYNKYRLLYDSCQNSKTAYDLNLDVSSKRYEDLKLDSLFVEIHVDKVAQDSSQNLALRFSMTQNHIEKVWYNLTELNQVNRLMLPDANGIAVDFSQSNSHIQKYAFAIPDSANIPLKDLNFIAFLQENTFLRYDTTIYSENSLFIQAIYNRQVHQTNMTDLSKIPGEIDKIENTSNIKVYPNPSANGIFYLSNEGNTKSYRVFDLFGKEILSAKANTNSLDLSKYAKGIYILQINGQSGVGKTIKLLRQ